MRILTDNQVADLERKFRLIQQDVKDLKDEKAELARRLRDAEARADRAEKREEKASIYVEIALGAVADMTAEEG